MSHAQTIVFLVRHGERADIYDHHDRRFDDQNILSPEGEKQGIVNGRYLKSFAPSAIYTSPIPRCVRTAELISAELDRPVKPKVSADLFEYYSPERITTLRHRAEHIVAKIVQEHAGEHIVAVTHQYVIKAVMASYFGGNETDYACDMADIYRLVFADHRLVEAVSLKPAHGV